MNITHVSTIGGIAPLLAKEQRKRDHKVTVAALGDHDFGFEYDEKLSLLERLRLPVRDSDIIHLHSCGAWPGYLEKYLDTHSKYWRKTVYSHHGSDVRFRGCTMPWLKEAHLISNPDLFKWCPNAVYVPLPAESAAWRKANDEFQTIQRLPSCNQKEFFALLTKQEKPLYDLPRFLFGSSSTSGVQAEALGKKVVSSVPFPHEVGHVCDLLDYVYERKTLRREK